MNKLVNILKRILQWLFFIALQIIFIPFIIVGIFLGIYKELVLGEKYGLSYSAGRTLHYRYYMHYFGTRHDPNTINFVKHFKCETHFGLYVTFGAFILAKKWFGLKTGLSEIPEKGMETLEGTAGARVRDFDQIMETYLDQVEQVLIPGVGYDLIANKYTRDRGIPVFEMDQTNTMKMKLATLKEAGIDHDWISYIPVDYDKEAWDQKLLDAGFDRTKKTLVIWQSVGHFLEEAVVKDVLAKYKDLCPEGSVIAQDFYDAGFIAGEGGFALKKQKNMMAKYGEPWVFGIDMSEDAKGSVEVFLNQCGLLLTDYKQYGEGLRLKPFYCIVTSEI